MMVHKVTSKKQELQQWAEVDNRFHSNIYVAVADLYNIYMDAVVHHALFWIDRMAG